MLFSRVGLVKALSKMRGLYIYKIPNNKNLELCQYGFSFSYNNNPCLDFSLLYDQIVVTGHWKFSPRPQFWDIRSSDTSAHRFFHVIILFNHDFITRRS